MLVAQLHQSRARRKTPREIDQRAAAGGRGVNERIKPEIDGHQSTFARAISVGPSRLWRASMIATAKPPGPVDFPAASSPATPMLLSEAAVAQIASCSTTKHAAINAEPAQPMPVTFAISGWPLAMDAMRSPSVTRSVAPERQTTMRLARA